jgi:hypothetical protein
MPTVVGAAGVLLGNSRTASVKIVGVTFSITLFLLDPVAEGLHLTG